jgi:hypothetical protein
MAVKWVERFHIYVLNCGNLSAGASLEDIPLPFDTDAPFELRGRGGRVQNDPRFGQAGMNGLLIRYRDALGRYTADAPVPAYLDMPGYGLGGAWKPVYPGRYYPIRSTLNTTISNTGPGAVNLTNLQLYYVGVKKFPASRPWVSFPQKCSTLPFKYTWWAVSPGIFKPTQNALIPPNTGGAWDQQQLVIQNDADFCMLGGQCGVFGVLGTPWFYQELFCNLMDQDLKPYMSSPVHVDWLFGSPHQSVVATEGDYFLPNGSQSNFQSLNPLSNGLIPGRTPLVGPYHPGLFYPQIYIPANQQHYFDLIRNDAQFTTAYDQNGDPTTIVPPSINFHITFEGLKVFHRG